MNHIESIALSALMHDIPHIMRQLEMENDITRLIPSSWKQVENLFSFLSNNHLQADLTNSALNESKIFTEIVSEAESISLAKTVDNNGIVSPLKSIFFGIHSSDDNISDRFFHASELSEAVLLDTKRSKKDIYFAPSYLITSFLDDIERTANHTNRPCIDTLYYIIRKYFWAITLTHHGNEFMFSYFDHAKITAAVACCLFVYLQHQHKHIFISQNSRVVRDTIQDYSEPRFLLIKLSSSNLHNNINVLHNIKKRSILMRACKNILALYGLYDFCILQATISSAIVITPNLDQDKLQSTLRDVNTEIFNRYGFESVINYQCEPIRKSDIVPHFSSSCNAADLLFRNINLNQSCMKQDFKFCANHYDQLFEAVKEDDNTNTNNQIDTNSYDHPALLFTDNPIDSDKPFFSRIDLKKKPTEIADHHSTSYQLGTTGNFLSNINDFPATYDRAFWLDSYDMQDEIHYPLVILRLQTDNPAPYLPAYPDLSHLNTYFSLGEILLQTGIGLYLNKRPETTVYWGCANELCFHATLEYIPKTLKKIYDFISEHIPAQPATYLKVYLSFDKHFSYNLTRQPIPSHGHGLYMLDSHISFDQAFELFEKSNNLLELYESMQLEDRSGLVQYIQYIRTYRAIPIDTSNIPMTNSGDISDQFSSYFDPLLLANWMSMLLTKEH